jgi:hypothetical protein
MRTTVVNIHHEDFDVYIGRAGKGLDGYFGNPHPVGRYCTICKATHNRNEAISLFQKDFNKKIEQDPEFKSRVMELKGKKLGCFCSPSACHGDVYVEYLENITKDYVGV